MPLRRRSWIAGTILIAAAAAGPGRAATVDVSAQASASINAGQTRAEDINLMNRGDSPFSAIRMLLLTRAKIDEDVQLFLEVPIDLGATSSTFLTYFRPFMRLQRLGDLPWLNAQVGKLPTVFGTYGERANSAGNTLISVPFLYFYHTALRSDGVIPGPEFFLESGIRGRGYQSLTLGPNRTFQGVPLIYDACWDIGAEFYGGHEGLEYAVAATLGSLSRPAITKNQNDGFGVVGRVGYRVVSGPLFGLRFGVSGAVSPYLSRSVLADENFPVGAEVEDFLNTGLGADLAYARGHWQFVAEAGHIGYEVPNVETTLYADSYYLEAVRDLGPSWSVGLRQDGVLFNDLVLEDGSEEPWDHDLHRTEVGISYRFRHGTRLRAGYQIIRFPGASELDCELFALQLQVWTR